MLYITRNFVVDRTAGALELMRQDGVTGLRAWAWLLWYLWVRPGMFRKIAGAWFKFFLPGFHPWNEDDRRLLGAYDARAPAEDAEPKRKVRRAVLSPPPSLATGSLGRERLVFLDRTVQLEPHQPRRDLFAARAAQPRRDDAERLEAELLEHPRRRRDCRGSASLRGWRGRASGRSSISAAQASVAKPRPQ